MNLAEFYASVPASEHSKIAASGDRLYYDGETYVVLPSDEVVKISDDAAIRTKLDLIANQTKTL